MSFLEHLEELRSRLLRSLLALVVGFFLAWPVSGRIYEFLVVPVKASLPPGEKLAYTGISDPFLLYTKLSVFAAIFLAFPYVLLQFWLFVAPGLYPRERKWVIPFVTVASIFFFMGAAFAYVVVVPYACRYFITLGVEAGFRPVITIREVFSFLLQLILACGGIFELPVVVFFLTRIGLLTPAFLWHYFGYAFFVVWALAAFMTPPDVISMAMVAVPMTLLYLLSILISWVFMPRK